MFKIERTVNLMALIIVYSPGIALGANAIVAAIKVGSMA